MRCIRCGSRRLERYRSPMEKQDVILRRHRCKECGHISLSVQAVVTAALGQRLLPLLEPEP